MKRKTASLFWTGRSQAVRLPKEFRFEGDKVRVRREGDAVILEPARGWPEGYVESFTGAPVVVSVITEGELRTGAAKSSSPVQTMRLVQNFLRPINIAEFTSDDAAVYAQVRAKLERAGTPIVREFRRVAGLKVENWAA